ncbi:hypothetical protein [Amphritea japonica]|uniref:Uncharacterized protein n=1 Tax=Amphritea japonica ATCC BAA-1530 TaxID=1278309 RepID=A0A7R6SSB1_9GAMM|nr:hypothetical protein [Amphritea japonica]BBB26159.1 conserved hypothetical protein [Amphritea japonica ATCC BAA-1530]
MTHKNLHKLCDIVTDAHTSFQVEIADIDPIVGVSQNMRANGVPADALTIDCLKNDRRIILILHDAHPDVINYQFAWRNKDPENGFTEVSFDEVTADKVLDWMKSYFVIG